MCLGCGSLLLRHFGGLDGVMQELHPAHLQSWGRQSK